VFCKGERSVVSEATWLLGGGLMVLNATLLIAGLSRSRAGATATLPVEAPAYAPGGGRPPDLSSVRSVSSPALSASACEQQLATARRESVRLERYAAKDLLLPVRFDREARRNSRLEVEVADVLLRTGAPGDVAPMCRGSLCRVEVPPSVERDFRMSDWAKDHLTGSSSALQGDNVVLVFETRDPRTDGDAFLTQVWQRFVNSGAPARCWQRATGGRLSVVLDLADDESQPAGPPRLTAHYYGPEVGEEVVRCVSESLDRQTEATTVAESLLPARVAKQVPKDL
jgi:hypothetical protein